MKPTAGTCEVRVEVPGIQRWIAGAYTELRLVRGGSLLLARTLSGVPYRDVRLTASRRAIVEHHRKVVARLRRRGWRKWLP